MTAPRLGCPDLGVGLGLRIPYYAYIFEHEPPLDFVEIISENFMVGGGRPMHHLDQVLPLYPAVQHGVSMNIGGPEVPSREYLTALRTLHERVKGPWLSDHFCWTGVPGALLHDLLPLPANDEAATRVIERARMVQDFLGVRFALENASSYMSFESTTMPEWEFNAKVAEEADVGLLFDVNNVYVSAYNHGFDPYEYVNAMPYDRIVQIHVAGHENMGPYIIDVHHGDIIQPVWDLYRYTIELAGPVSTIVEWDTDIPEFPVAAALVEKVRGVRDEALAARDARVRAGKPAAPPKRTGRVPTQTPPDPMRNPHRRTPEDKPVREYSVEAARPR